MNIKQELVLAAELKTAAYTKDVAAHAWQTLADALNARASAPNPVTQPAVRLDFTWGTFINLLTEAEILGLYQYGALAADLRQALEADNRTELLALWRAAKTKLTAATVTKVEAEFGKTRPDPTWQATVLQPSIAMTLALPVLTAEDVQTVAHRHLGV